MKNIRELSINLLAIINILFYSLKILLTQSSYHPCCNTTASYLSHGYKVMPEREQLSLNCIKYYVFPLTHVRNSYSLLFFCHCLSCMRTESVKYRSIYFHFHNEKYGCMNIMVLIWWTMAAIHEIQLTKAGNLYNLSLFTVWMWLHNSYIVI
jgi:hypothetical protein